MGHKIFYLKESFFDCIDTEQKAYILGFIFADGNIGKTDDCHYRLRITLKNATVIF